MEGPILKRGGVNPKYDVREGGGVLENQMNSDKGGGRG